MHKLLDVTIYGETAHTIKIEKCGEKSDGKNKNSLNGNYRVVSLNDALSSKDLPDFIKKDSQLFIKKPTKKYELFTEWFAGQFFEACINQGLIDELYKDSFICSKLIKFGPKEYGLVQPKIDFRELYTLINTGQVSKKARSPIIEFFWGKSRYKELMQGSEYFGLTIPIMWQLIIGNNSIHSGNVGFKYLSNNSKETVRQFILFDYGAALRLINKDIVDICEPPEYQNNIKKYTKGYIAYYKDIPNFFQTIKNRANDLKNSIDIADKFYEITLSILRQFPKDVFLEHEINDLLTELGIEDKNFWQAEGFNNPENLENLARIFATGFNKRFKLLYTMSIENKFEEGTTLYQSIIYKPFNDSDPEKYEDELSQDYEILDVTTINKKLEDNLRELIPSELKHVSELDLFLKEADRVEKNVEEFMENWSEIRVNNEFFKKSMEKFNELNDIYLEKIIKFKFELTEEMLKIYTVDSFDLINENKKIVEKKIELIDKLYSKIVPVMTIFESKLISESYNEFKYLEELFSEGTSKVKNVLHKNKLYEAWGLSKPNVKEKDKERLEALVSERDQLNLINTTLKQELELKNSELEKVKIDEEELQHKNNQLKREKTKIEAEVQSLKGMHSRQLNSQKMIINCLKNNWDSILKDLELERKSAKYPIGDTLTEVLKNSADIFFGNITQQSYEDFKKGCFEAFENAKKEYAENSTSWEKVAPFQKRFLAILFLIPYVIYTLIAKNEMPFKERFMGTFFPRHSYQSTLIQLEAYKKRSSLWFSGNENIFSVIINENCKQMEENNPWMSFNI